MSSFNELKLAHKYKYIIYSLNKDYSEIIIEHTATPDGQSNEDAFNEFREKLPSDDGRYAVFDFEFEKADGSGKRNKICFFSWCVRLCSSIGLGAVCIYADYMRSRAMLIGTGHRTTQRSGRR